MIEVLQLEKSFNRLKVLKGINACFEPGNVVSIIGPNASGKTTLIKCLLGMVIPDKGNILFDGVNIRENERYREHIGYMPQIGRYPDNIKIRQLFAMMKDIRNSKEDTAPDEELLELFRLRSIFHKPVGTLSGGTRQKLSAALAFLFDPSVLILDEPTGGLDPEAAEILKTKILKEKGKGKLVLITSHIMSEVAEVADSVLSLLEGKVIFYKRLDDILSEMEEEKFSRAIVKLINRYQDVENF